MEATRDDDEEFLPSQQQYDLEWMPSSFFTIHTIGWPWGLACVPCLAVECLVKGACCLARATSGTGGL